MSQQANDRVRALLEDAERGAPITPTTEPAKVGTYYAAFMDEAKIEDVGLRPLNPELQKISLATDRTDLARIMGTANRGFQGSLFALSIEPDSRNAARNALYLSQSGIGSLDRDFYFQTSYASARKAYKAYIQQALTFAAWPVSDETADTVVDFETKIAVASSTTAENRDETKNYNPTTMNRLARTTPGFAWDAFFNAAGLTGNRRVVVVNTTAIPALATLYQTTPLPVLKAWATFHLMDNAAPFLSSSLVRAHFAFHGTTLAGKQEPLPRWRNALRLVSGGTSKSMDDSRGSMGDAVGRLYAKRWFDERSRVSLMTLVTNLKEVLKERIQASDWMSPETRSEALRKVAATRVEIGVPARSDEYTGLRIFRDDLFGNVQRATAFAWHADLLRLDKPVERDRWTMTPQTVNAYNYAPFNEVVFTAALLEPPAFDPEQDIALTYGRIGAIIGHELTHSFDDVGREYDAAGRQRDWWTPQDAKTFQNKAHALVALYSACEAAPDLHVNGDLTLGENIADIGGLQIAYAAYHKALDHRPAPMIDGLSGDQRFFLGFAMLRRGHRRVNALRSDVQNDPHTPDQCRVNNVVREVDGWYQAFNITKVDPLYLPPSERIHFW